MLDYFTLTTALPAGLPVPQKVQVIALADAIFAALADQSTEGLLAVHAPLVEALVGKQLIAGGTLVSCGKNNDMYCASITTGDVTGSHIVKDTPVISKVAITTPIPIDPAIQLAQAQELFATLPFKTVSESVSLQTGLRMTRLHNPSFVGRDADLQILIEGIKDNRVLLSQPASIVVTRPTVIVSMSQAVYAGYHSLSAESAMEQS